jgi:hypothetical protein
MSLPSNRKVCLLLTATIDPNGMPFTRRSAPRRRLKDYRNALKKWSSCTLFDSIVLCENSGHDLSELQASTCGRVRFLSFSGNDYPRHLGKGYGEMNILRHVLSESALAPDDLIVKITGRYYVRNADALIAYIKSRPDCEVFCDITSDGAFAPSGMFAGSVRFLEHYLVIRQNRVNDTAGIYFEHALAEAMNQASEDGLRCVPFLDRPLIEGRSGTSSGRCNSSWVTEKIWYPALALTKPIRRRIGLDQRALHEILARFHKAVH